MVDDPGICRICLSPSVLEPSSGRTSPILHPCRCKGTQGGLHALCLARWLSESGRPYCELCRYAYQLEIRPAAILTLIYTRRPPRHPIRLLLHILYCAFVVNRTLQLIRYWYRARARPVLNRILLSFLIGHSCLFLVADARFIHEEVRDWIRREARMTIVDHPFGARRRIALP